MPEFYDIIHQDIKRNTYPLRPEYVESIFYLYKATEDPILLEMGAEIVESIERSAKTECGYATVKDVHKHIIEDRMESFFIAETVKYLYLLFDHDNFVYNQGGKGKHIKVQLGSKSKSCVIDTGSYVFNTEAHPIDLAAVDCCHAIRQQNQSPIDVGLNQTVQFQQLLTESIESLVNAFQLSIDQFESIHQSSAINRTTSVHNLDESSQSVFHSSSACAYHSSLVSCPNCYYDLLTCPRSDFLQHFSFYGQVQRRDRDK
jgi:hypothetical protein